MGMIAGLGVFAMLVWLAIAVVVIASWWVVFTKAGKPGWACLVPIYNFIVILEIAGKPLWWIILMLLPLVNIVIGILVMIEFAKHFGKSAGFAIGMLLLPFIFFPMLAWGDATYRP